MLIVVSVVNDYGGPIVCDNCITSNIHGMLGVAG